ncbi:carbohydrate ABC transporter permease [Paenibacillus antri]|uniref:Carbohydrate ABC transporter permease n=1 Tax=Paenibacillus antri TaxID=2582848 RepID=A0A5R9G937_9BACL|nr:carbohydrate ABC transporter permease [Paenibacillus antri]TLS50610.1 carbohydrate ABC transporter permease [Paenibacillus antri]
MKQGRLQYGDIINYIALTLISLSMLFPFLYVFSVSLTDPATYVQGEFILLPKEFSLDSYKFVLGTGQLWNSVKATLFITVVGTVLNLFVTMTFAYVLTKNDMPGWKLFTYMVLFMMFFHAGMVPGYLLVRELGLMNSLWALILPGLTNPWSLFVVRSFYRSIPSSLEEAAYIDGANDLTIFQKVILPLSKPVIAAFSLFFAVGLWNTYLSGIFYIQDPKKWPLQVFLSQMIIESNTDLGSSANFDDVRQVQPPSETIKMASLVLVMIPILLVYPFLQKHFAKGVLLGSVKG